MDIVDIQSIEPEDPHRGRGTINDPHTAKQKSKTCPGQLPRISRFKGSGGNRGRGKGVGWKNRRDGVTNRRKGSKVEYLEFSTPFFIHMYI